MGRIGQVGQVGQVGCGPALFAFGKSWLTEVGGFGASGVAVDEIGNARENQHRGEARGDDVHLIDAEVAEFEFLELPCTRQPSHTDAQSELGRMIISHNSALRSD
jgi:hypothetical protein